MVNEIEEGVYIGRNEKIQQFNKPKTKKCKKNTILQKEGSYTSHKFGKVVETRKMMPKFTKVTRVPNPDSKIFQNFEKFLQQSRKDNVITADVTGITDESLTKPIKEKINEEDFYSRIIESKEYQECKNFNFFFEWK